MNPPPKAEACCINHREWLGLYTFIGDVHFQSSGFLFLGIIQATVSVGEAVVCNTALV